MLPNLIGSDSLEPVGNIPSEQEDPDKSESKKLSTEFEFEDQDSKSDEEHKVMSRAKVKNMQRRSGNSNNA